MEQSVKTTTQHLVQLVKEAASHIAKAATAHSKAAIAICAVLVVAVIAGGCGHANGYVGDWRAQSIHGHHLELVIEANGTATYQEDDSDPIPGTWKQEDGYLILDFNGEVTSHEPLKAILSQNGQTLTLTADSPHWIDDYYQRVGN